MSKQTKSDVWKFMTKVNDKQCKCNVCSKVLVFHGGTTNLRDHLTSAHLREFNDGIDPSAKSKSLDKQSKITSHFSKPCGTDRGAKITNLLIDIICRDMRPISSVNSPAFHELLQYLEPTYKVPCNTHLTSLISLKHQRGKDKMRQYLKEAPSVAITTDTWTSCSNESYLTITAHFILNWKLVSCVLQTTAMDEKHSAENLADKLVTAVVSDWGLEKCKICAVVHDNARNMTRMNTILNVEMECPTWNNVPCTAHSLQLAINAALNHPPVQTAIAACRKLVGHFRHSTTATAELHKAQEIMQLPAHELIQDVSTRWNSVLYMGERAIEQRWAMSKVLTNPTVTPNRDHRNLDLQNHQWELLEQLVKVLKPLEVATTLFCYEDQVCLSAVLPIICRLVEVLDTKDEADLEPIACVKQIIKEQMKRRWNLHEIQVKSPLVLSAALDPRFKSLSFLNAAQVIEAKSCLLAMATSIQATLPQKSDQAVVHHLDESPPAKYTKLSAWDILLGKEESNVEAHEVHAECERYAVERCTSRESDPLKWWAANASCYPTLSVLAKTYLCIPGTSAPSERVFSSAGLTVSRLRNSLAPGTVDSLIFLGSNFDLLRDSM